MRGGRKGKRHPLYRSRSRHQTFDGSSLVWPRQARRGSGSLGSPARGAASRAVLRNLARLLIWIFQCFFELSVPLDKFILLKQESWDSAICCKEPFQPSPAEFNSSSVLPWSRDPSCCHSPLSFLPQAGTCSQLLPVVSCLPKDILHAGTIDVQDSPKGPFAGLLQLSHHLQLRVHKQEHTLPEVLTPCTHRGSPGESRLLCSWFNQKGTCYWN